MRRLRVPPPMAYQAMIERCGPDGLLRIFRASLTTRPNKADYGLLAGAWGSLFARTYLSAEEMVDEMERGVYRFSGDDDRMLRDFIRQDCASGGLFVVEVIRNGGTLDRAALVLFADLNDLATVEFNGVTAVQLLLEACDKRTRPYLIRKAGKHFLGEVYDKRDLPLIFTIYGLCDVRENDLDAIASVFTEKELGAIMSRSRTGNTALDVFTSIATALKRYPSYERDASLIRNPFFISAQKDALGKKPEKPRRTRRHYRPPEPDTED